MIHRKCALCQQTVFCNLPFAVEVKYRIEQNISSTPLPDVQVCALCVSDNIFRINYDVNVYELFCWCACGVINECVHTIAC